MTLKEAKKILKKEGFIVDKIGKPRTVFDFFIENEAPDICEAMQVVSTAGYDIYMEANRFEERKDRLKKEHEENTNDPGSSREQPNEGNPALSESASQFNDALLDEQADKIKRLGKEITRLNKIIHKKNEELRLTKIREKNLAELGLKYVGENEELKEKLDKKIVDKIDAQALKSAESALAYKEKVIAEKDEVIADLGKELKEKHKKYVWYKGAYEAAKQILNTIADYASKHPDKKFSDQMVGVDIAEEGADLTGVIIIKSEK